jgi:hypothetical protein
MCREKATMDQQQQCSREAEKAVEAAGVGVQGVAATAGAHIRIKGGRALVHLPGLAACACSPSACASASSPSACACSPLASSAHSPAAIEGRQHAVTNSAKKASWRPP